ncbi:MAG: phage protein Gp36 family protein [Flavipsychrobacter sp.]
MAFLTEQDYKTVLKQDFKALILEGDAATQTDAELKAQAEMSTYLRKRYDVAQIFNKVGTERNYNIVMLLTDMVIYHIYSSRTPRNIPELRLDRYDYATKMLTRMSDGTIEEDLPIRKNEDNEEINPLRTGSHTPTTHGY